MTDAASADAAAPRWHALSTLERRLLGVLIEKAKTTPEAYPMTINSLVTGANQKNNRHPLLNASAESVEAAMQQLRTAGAVTEIHGLGRVAKYRHQAYEWLGVDKVEAAIMAELLLRGAQTEGELRTRASRMEPIADLPTLRTLLDGLQARGLVLPLTPPGRGHVVTHNLYEPQQLEKVRAEFVGRAPSADDESDAEEPIAAPRGASGGGWQAAVDELRQEVSALRDELARLKSALGV